jgi:tetratricopeptide (TPR) repeat protein
MQDYNDVNIDPNLLCDLAYENLIEFIKTDLNYNDILIRALAYFLESIEIEGRNYKAHFGLGISLLICGMYQESINFLNNACDINPSASSRIKKYIDLAKNYENESKKSNKKLSSKRSAINDLLDMGSKFKI